MAKDTRPEDCVRAIVSISGSRRIIGEVSSKQLTWFVEGCEEEPMHIYDALEIQALTRQVEVAPGQYGIAREVMVFPIDICTHPVAMHVQPVDVIILSELHPADALEYEEQVKRCMAQIDAARVQKLGLTLAGPGEHLGGKIGRT